MKEPKSWWEIMEDEAREVINDHEKLEFIHSVIGQMTACVTPPKSQRDKALKYVEDLKRTHPVDVSLPAETILNCFEVKRQPIMENLCLPSEKGGEG